MDQRILIADHDAELRVNLMYGLKQEGCNVVACCDSESALAILQSAKENEIFYDAVVIGASLDDSDALRLASEIRNKYPYASLLCITGSDRVESDQRILDGPNTTFITQPFEMPEFIEKVQSITNGKCAA